MRDRVLPTYLSFWGKASPKRRPGEPLSHSLAYHGLDVAAAADVLMRHNPRKLQAMARLLATSPENAPRGSRPVPNPAREAEEVIAYEVRQEKLRRYGNRVPRGKLDELIREVSEDMAESLEGVSGIRIENIRSKLKRGAKRKTKAKVND